MRQLRPRIFTLWKALLLGRRVLFYAPPPVGRLCERALCAHQLQLGWAGHPAPRTDLLLYVGLNDEHGRWSMPAVLSEGRAPTRLPRPAEGSGCARTGLKTPCSASEGRLRPVDAFGKGWRENR